MKYFILLITLIIGLYTSNLKACDGFTVNTISTEYVGGGQYLVTVQYCEFVSNGAGSSVHGVYLEITGANIISAVTTSITSNATGVTMNFNQLNANTCEWGDWDNDGAPIFMDDGDPEECFTLQILCDGPPTDVLFAGSSDATNLGSGFVLINGRYACAETVSFPPPVCGSDWDPFVLCNGDVTPVDLNAMYPGSGTWSGPNVNSATGIYTPSGVGPDPITFTVDDNGFTCSTTHDITYNSITSVLPPSYNFCGASGIQMDATGTSTADPNCEYLLEISESFGDGMHGAFVEVFINGVSYGSYSVAACGTPPCVAQFPIPVADGDLIQLSYTGAIYNNENTVRFFDGEGNQLLNVTDPPNGNVNYTASCVPVLTYSWSPTTGLDDPTSPTPTTSTTTNQTYTVTISDGNCAIDFTTDVIVNGPDLTVTDPTPICEGTGTIDFTTGVVSSGNVTYHTSQADADNGVNPIAGTTVSTGQTIYVRAETIADPSCFITDVITVSFYPIPVVSIDPVADLCNNDPVYNLVGTPAGGVFSGTGVSGTTFNPATAGVNAHTIQYDYTDGNGCSASATTNINVIYCCAVPTLNVTDPASICEGTGTIDFTTGVTSSGTVTYHNTQADADNGVNALGSNTVAAASTVYVRSEDPLDPTCYTTDIITVTFNANPQPNINVVPDQCDFETTYALSADLAGGVFSGTGVTGSNFDASAAGIGTYTITYDYTDANGCSGSNTTDINVIYCCAAPTLSVTDPAPICEGTGTIDFTTGVTSSGTVTYHNTQADADNGLNALGTNTAATASTVYVRSEDPLDPTCYITEVINVNFNTNPQPNINAVPDQCDFETTYALSADLAGGVFSGTGVTGSNFDASAAGIGTHTITYDYTDGNGCSGSNTTDINVIYCCVTPTLSVTDPAPICEGTGTIDFTTGVTSSGTVTYHNSQADADNGLNALGTNTVAAASTVYVRSEDPLDPTCYTTDIITITFNANPQPNINAVPDQCDFETTYALSADLAGGVFSGTGVTGSNFDASAAGIGTYTITYDYTDANGCSGSNTTDINVIYCCVTPTLNVTDPAPICEGTGTIDFTTGVTSSGTVTYHNSQADADNGVNALGSNTVAAASTVYVRSEDPNDATCYITDLIQITFTANPFFTTTDLTVCNGDQIALTVSGLTPTNAVVSWSNGWVNGQNYNAPNISTMYYVTANNNGCTYSDSLFVNVSSPVITGLSATAETCENLEDGTLNVIANGLNPISYVWSTTPPATTPYVSDVSPGTYNVTVTDGNGCSVDSSVVVSPGVALDFDYNTIDIPCDQLGPIGEIEITNVTGGQAPYTYSIDGGLTFETINTFSGLSSGNYTIIVQDQGGCILSSNAEINMGNPPTASFNVSPSRLDEVNTNLFMNSHSNSSFTHEWTVEGNVVSNDTSHIQSFISQDAGTYEVCLTITDVNGCMDYNCINIEKIETCYVFVPNAVTFNDDGTNDLFGVEVSCAVDDFEIIIVDRWGAILYKSINPYEKWDGVMASGKKIKDGVYTYKVVYANNGSSVEKYGTMTVLR